MTAPTPVDQLELPVLDLDGEQSASAREQAVAGARTQHWLAKNPLFGYTITRYDLNLNLCRHCGTKIVGHYDAAPGNWGSRRQPVRISEYEVRASREYGISPGPAQTTTPLTITSSPSRSVSQPMSVATPSPPA